MGRLLAQNTTGMPRRAAPQAPLRDPYGAGDVERGEALAAAPTEDEPRRKGLAIAQVMQDGTTPEEVDQAVSTLRARGLGSQQITEELANTARRKAVEDHARRRAEALTKYQDAMQRAQAESESENIVQTIFRAIGDIASASQGGPTNPVTDRVMAQRADRRKQSEAAAGRTLDLELGEVDAQRQDERDLQQGTLFDQSQSDRTQSKTGALARAKALEQELIGAKIAVPPGAAERDPEGFLAFYEPRFQSATKRSQEVADREDTQRHQLQYQEEGIVLRSAFAKSAAGTGKSGATFNQVNTARNSYDRHTKAAFTVIDNATRIRTALEQGGGVQDIAALYGLIRALDPESVVREGEVRLTQAGLSAMSQLQLLGQRIFTDRTLSDTQRQEILQLTSAAAAEMERIQVDYEQNTAQLATAYGIDPSHIMSRSLMRDANRQSQGAEQQMQQYPTASGQGQQPQRPPINAQQAAEERERRRRAAAGQP